MELKGTPREIVEFIDEVFVYVKEFRGQGIVAAKIDLDNSRIAQANLDKSKVMGQAFRKAIRDNFEAEHQQPQDNNV